MAQSQDVSVARAVFISALLPTQSDAPAVQREDATLFVKTLLKTCNICTTPNIKLCKSFILHNIAPSTPRTAALVKYLLILSRSFCPREVGQRIDTTKPGDDNEGLGNIVNGKLQQPPQPAFKRLHLLYIVHDVLSYSQTHSFANTKALDQLRAAICSLAELAACEDHSSGAKTYPLVCDLVKFWEQKGIFTPQHIERLRSRIQSAEGSSWDSLLDKINERPASGIEDDVNKDQSGWILPKRHGAISDPTAPWDELPAANGLYLMRTRGYPLRSVALPQGGFSVRQGGEEADEQLKQDVQNLHKEALHCFDKYTDAAEMQDIDALGNIIWKDPERPTRNYWGWTIDGIEKRKELAQDFARSAKGYADYGPVVSMQDAVERARALAAERGRGYGRGRGMHRGGGGGGGGGGGWRGGARW